MYLITGTTNTNWLRNTNWIRILNANLCLWIKLLSTILEQNKLCVEYWVVLILNFDSKIDEMIFSTGMCSTTHLILWDKNIY